MNISFLVNAHREGLLLHAALRSTKKAQELCRHAALTTETILVADRPDEPTKAVTERWSERLDRVEYVDHGSLGPSRMRGLELATGDYVCFLDGDDIWQPEWPSLAYAQAQGEATAGDTIYHTEVFAEFGVESSLRRQIGTDDPLFHPNHLVATWHYCNNLFAVRNIFKRYPILAYDHSRGFGSEDWHWSCETCHAGIRRSVVPRTVYFYRSDPSKPSLGQTPWLVIRETGLFRADQRVTEYPEYLGVQQARGPLLRELNAVRHRRPVPEWLSSSIETACETDYDLWHLREKLPGLRVETPRLYVIVAAAFGEMRRLYDECGSFGIIAIKSQGRDPGDFAKLFRITSRASARQPLVIVLDKSVQPDQPIYRDGNRLYLDISFMFEADGSTAYSVRQLFMTAIVQLRPAFFLSAEHWLGESLSYYRASIAELGLRFGYVGTSLDADSANSRTLIARIQNGTAWYNEVWLGMGEGQKEQFSHLCNYGDISIFHLPDCDAADALDLAIANRRPSIPERLGLADPPPEHARWIPGSAPPRVTCVLNVHREREILLPTLCSVSRMLRVAAQTGVTAELLVVCDDSDRQTRNLVSRFLGSQDHPPAAIIEIEERNLGIARNAGIAEARGEFVCLLDADDLYSENWIGSALKALLKNPIYDAAVHPALNVYFGREHRQFWHPVWNAPEVPALGLLFENYWTSLSFGRTALYRRIPFASVDVSKGFGFEDWHWNLQVLASGGTHIVADRTCHFIRLKDHGSLSQLSASRRCVIRPTDFVRTLVRSRNGPDPGRGI